MIAIISFYFICILFFFIFFADQLQLTAITMYLINSMME